MRISSRTPEGFPHHCPICDADICIEPSRPPGDAPCPNCGHLLWFEGPVARKRINEALLSFLRDGEGRPIDNQGNVLDPLTGHVDFAGTFAACSRVRKLEPKPDAPIAEWLLGWLLALIRPRAESGS
jgi:hypothetical protein